MNRHFIVSSTLVLTAVGLYVYPSPDPLERPTPGVPEIKPRPGTMNDEGHEPQVTFIRPGDLGVRPADPNYNHPARISGLIEAGDMASLQSATLSWFEHDPSAALDWLASQPTLEEFQPAISHIAHRISDRGDLELALEWAALLTEENLHDTTVFDIFALALRNGRLSPSDIPQGILSDSHIEELLNGAPGD